MEFMNLLADVPISIFGQTFDISLNWIGKFVKLIISSGVGVGVGVILFSLILKVIVLPFDVFQRISMRKQNLKMKENKERMEKLQKQYANDKQMYNQKVMELQREGGFSMLASCLPMILSMVIFFIAIGAFNAYAKFSTVDNYNTLVNAYKGAVNEYVVDTDDAVYTPDFETEEGVNSYYILVKEDVSNDGAEDKANKLIYFRAPVTEEEYNGIKDKTQAEIKEKALNVDANKRAYFIDVEKAKTYEETQDVFAEKEGKYPSDKEIKTGLLKFFEDKGAAAAEEAYDTKVSPKIKFLWIKNIWATDASYKHPVLSHDDFLKDVAAASCGSSCNSNGSFIVNGKEVSVGNGGELLDNKNVRITTVYEKESYNKVTRNLSEEKEKPNGYFVLIVLSIGTIILQQFITQRSQKEQQKYSSVDGQAASTQKMTMIIMTLMFGVFSFMYSSAFSIYMIMSNVFSLGSTLIINYAVDKVAAKKEQQALQAKYNKRLPRTGNTAQANKKNDGAQKQKTEKADNANKAEKKNKKK